MLEEQEIKRLERQWRRPINKQQIRETITAATKYPNLANPQTTVQNGTGKE